MEELVSYDLTEQGEFQKDSRYGVSRFRRDNAHTIPIARKKGFIISQSNQFGLQIVDPNHQAMIGTFGISNHREGETLVEMEYGNLIITFNR